MFTGYLRSGIVTCLTVLIMFAGFAASVWSAEKKTAEKPAVEKKVVEKETSGKSQPDNISGMSSVKKEDTNAKKKAAKPLKRRILYFQAPWCYYCQEVKEDAYPKLKSVKWKIGMKETDHIQEIDTDKFPKLTEKFKIESLPTFVLIVDGKEVDRRGILGAYEIAELYYGRLKKEE